MLVLTAARRAQQVALVLQEVQVPHGVQGNFDVVAVRRERKVRLASFGIVGEPDRAMDHARNMTLLLDATHALSDLAAKEHPVTLRIVPRGRAKHFDLQARGAELRIFSTQRDPKKG